MSGSKSDAENDLGPDGGNLVRLHALGNFFFIYNLGTKSIRLRLTNDGNAILREIDVAHPAAKNMIELSRTQDEECGDGTTSVIILGASVQSILLSWRFRLCLQRVKSWHSH